MLIYAVGRGLEYYDQCSLDQIKQRFGAGRLSFLAIGAGSRQERIRFRSREGSGVTNEQTETNLSSHGTAWSGANIGLPLLEAMLPAGRGPRTVRQAKPPVRMAFLYVPNGMHMPAWTPEKTGADFEIPPTLEPLAKFQSEMTVLSGLTLNGARALGDGAGDHARSVAAFLTGAHPKKTNGADIYNGVSVDQLAAAQDRDADQAAITRIGYRSSAKAGQCDSGYSCVYTSNMCWRSPTSPVAKEVDPAAVFDRLFGDALKDQSLQNDQSRIVTRTSVLDLVLEDATALQNKLGVTDRRKLDEYLYAVA